MTYRKEAALRVAYFGAAALVSLIVGIIVAFIVGTFASANAAQIAGLVAFVVACVLLVNKIDQTLNKRFNQNP